ncbi:MAG: lipoate--protein ligase [Robiginitomaculum sp.]|nr:MAG: lipoate--protein ligase [Robiginitomaculum sp.]
MPDTIAPSPQFRVIDTGLRTGRENIAFDQAMIDAHRCGEIPDTIRFIHFKPVALLGRHQALSQEVHQDECAARGIEIGRRITGGGAIYLDEGQLGWALVMRRKTLGLGGLGETATAICEAAAVGLSGLGINARFRPRNDIEVGGRKISGTGGFFDGDTLIYQGTVLVDLNSERMFAALNVAKAKLERKSLDSAADRVTCLRALLGDQTPTMPALEEALISGFARHLGIQPIWGEATNTEEQRAKTLYEEEIGTDGFVAEIDDPARETGVLAGSYTNLGGTVNAFVRLEGARNERLREVLISGDFFVTPPRIIYDLEASLRRVPIVELQVHIQHFFERTNVGMLSVAPDDFALAIINACAVKK